MDAGDNIFKQHPTTRLARLESQNIAKNFASQASQMRQMSDRLLAAIENRIIEYVLIRRLRRGIASTHDEASTGNLLDEMRSAYNSGAMETLPSFLPTPQSIQYAPETGNSSDRHTKSNARPVILYTSGGGFLFPLSKKQKQMIQQLAECTGCEIVPGTHRLAPENPFPAAPNDIADQYEKLIEEGINPKLLFMGGDTAGASVTMGALQLIQNRKLVSPAGIVLFAPWCDLGMSGWSYITGSVSSQSPFRMETAAFCARVYLQDASPFEPLASAIYSDATNWPPILIHTSKFDLHFDDAIKLAEMGEACGRDISLNYWDSPRHHLERLSSKDSENSFVEVSKFIHRIISGN